MKAIGISKPAILHPKRVSISLFAAAAICLVPHAMAATTVVNLAGASRFAILAGAGITFGGAVNSIPIGGDIGSYPTLSITGFTNVILNGINQGGNTETQVAKNDLVNAYNDAAGRTPDSSLGPVYDLGGQSFSSGVYNSSSSFAITGTLTLDAMGDPNAVWIFQAGSTLSANSGSKVVLTGGAKAENVFWQVGSSATLGTGSQFVGSVMALDSITVNTSAMVEGRLLARNGAVTMGASTSVIPEPSSFLLVSAGLVVLLGGRRRALAEGGRSA